MVETLNRCMKVVIRDCGIMVLNPVWLDLSSRLTSVSVGAMMVAAVAGFTMMGRGTSVEAVGSVIRSGA